jgi:hypothetical protein
MFYGGYDYQMGKERMVEMRTEVEHNRLESRLAEAPRAKGALSEKLSPRRGMAARGAAVVLAMFRYAA